MIIYYHCTRDSVTIFTNLPSLHPFSFHEMIFILVPPANVVSRNIKCNYGIDRRKRKACERTMQKLHVRNKKLTTPPMYANGVSPEIVPSL